MPTDSRSTSTSVWVSRQVVVWLDDVQDLLVQDRFVEQLDRLLDLSRGPTVVLATLRTDAEYALRGTAAWRRLDRDAERITFLRRGPLLCAIEARRG